MAEQTATHRPPRRPGRPSRPRPHRGRGVTDPVGAEQGGVGLVAALREVLAGLAVDLAPAGIDVGGVVAVGGSHTGVVEQLGHGHIQRGDDVGVVHPAWQHITTPSPSRRRPMDSDGLLSSWAGHWAVALPWPLTLTSRSWARSASITRSETRSRPVPPQRSPWPTLGVDAATARRRRRVDSGPGVPGPGPFAAHAVSPFTRTGLSSSASVGALLVGQRRGFG